MFNYIAEIGYFSKLHVVQDNYFQNLNVLKFLRSEKYW